jgi:phospholipid/cholesterol/gamma-HCH transport system permease protein
MPEGKMQIESEGDATVIYLAGPLDHRQVPALWPRLTETIGRPGAERVIIDCGQVSGIDSAGLALLRLLNRKCSMRRLDCTPRNMPERVSEFLRYAEERSGKRREEKPVPEFGFIGRTGLAALEIFETTVGAVSFLGEFLMAGGSALRHWRRLNIIEIFYQMQKVGAEAVPFVFILSGLMGYIVGMQSTESTTISIGIHVADAVTMGTMKEMAPLLTAVILVGRTGAAFAAEIGTMQVKEEIAALEVMGFDPMHYLVLPRVVGLVLAGPLLVMIADAAGIFGGTIQGMMVLDLGPMNYLVEVSKVLQPGYIYEGFIKGFVFAATIGINGCFHGFRTGTAAESVGVQTTASVVTGIFFIVLFDALLAGIFHVLNL